MQSFFYFTQQLSFLFPPLLLPAEAFIAGSFCDKKTKDGKSSHNASCLRYHSGGYLVATGWYCRWPVPWDSQSHPSIPPQDPVPPQAPFTLSDVVCPSSGGNSRRFTKQIKKNFIYRVPF